MTLQHINYLRKSIITFLKMMIQQSEYADEGNLRPGLNIGQLIQKIKNTDFQKFRVLINIVGGTKKSKSLKANQMIGFQLLIDRQIEDQTAKLHGLFAIEQESTTILNTHYIYSPHIQEYHCGFSQPQTVSSLQKYQELLSKAEKNIIPINTKNLRMLEDIHIQARKSLDQKDFDQMNLDYSMILQEIQDRDISGLIILRANFKVLGNQYLSQHCVLVDTPGFQDNAVRHMKHELVNNNYSPQNIIIFCIDPLTGSIDAKSHRQILYYYETQQNPDNISLSISVSGIKCNFQRKVENLGNLYYSAFVIVPKQFKNLLIQLLEKLQKQKISYDIKKKIQIKIKLLQNFTKMHDQIYQVFKIQEIQAQRKVNLKLSYQDKNKSEKLRKVIDIYPYDLINFHGFNILSFMDLKYNIVDIEDPFRLLKERSKKQQQQYLVARTNSLFVESFEKIQIYCQKVRKQLIFRSNMNKLPDAQRNEQQEFRKTVAAATTQLFEKLKKNLGEYKSKMINQFQSFGQLLKSIRSSQLQTKTIYLFRSTVKADIQRKISESMSKIVKQSENGMRKLIEQCKIEIKQNFKQFKLKSQSQISQNKTIQDFQNLANDYVKISIQETVTQIEKIIEINKKLGIMYGLKLYFRSFSPLLFTGLGIAGSQILRTVITQSTLTALKVISMAALPIGITITVGFYVAQQIYKRRKDKKFFAKFQQFKNYTFLADKSIQKLVKKLHNQRDLSLDLSYLNLNSTYEIFQGQKIDRQTILQDVLKQRKRIEQNFKTNFLDKVVLDANTTPIIRQRVNWN